jgi:hypothetical protein
MSFLGTGRQQAVATPASDRRRKSFDGPRLNDLRLSFRFTGEGFISWPLWCMGPGLSPVQDHISSVPIILYRFTSTSGGSGGRVGTQELLVAGCLDGEAACLFRKLHNK